MKNVQWITKVIIVLAFFSSIGCSKSDDGGGGGDDFFIPDLSRGWLNKDDATKSNFFFWSSYTDSVNTSTFEGHENLPPDGSKLDNFTGSFTNHKITFKYDAGSSNNKSGKSYSGTINDSSTVITLTSPDLGNLTLIKQP